MTEKRPAPTAYVRPGLGSFSVVFQIEGTTNGVAMTEAELTHGVVMAAQHSDEYRQALIERLQGIRSRQGS